MFYKDIRDNCFLISLACQNNNTSKTTSNKIYNCNFKFCKRVLKKDEFENNENDEVKNLKDLDRDNFKIL